MSMKIIIKWMRKLGNRNMIIEHYYKIKAIRGIEKENSQRKEVLIMERFR